MRLFAFIVVVSLCVSAYAQDDPTTDAAGADIGIEVDAVTPSQDTHGLPGVPEIEWDHALPEKNADVYGQIQWMRADEEADTTRAEIQYAILLELRRANDLRAERNDILRGIDQTLTAVLTWLGVRH
jgi:hypothetical protein